MAGMVGDIELTKWHLVLYISLSQYKLVNQYLHKMW